MKKKILVIIQARLTSKRFPNKVLKKIGKYSIIEIILKRVKESQLINDIVVAVPSNKENNKLKDYLKKINAKLFSGSENNVIKRFYNAAKEHKATHIVRVTGDCPLIDSRIIDNLILKFFKNKLDYINNANPPYLSDGYDVEIFSTKVLKVALDNAKSNFDIEHVTPFIKKSNKFKKMTTGNINNFGIKLSIDIKEDLKRVKKIFKFFSPNIYFSVNDIFKKKLHLKFFQNEIKKEKILSEKTKKGQKLWKNALKVIPGGNMLLSKNPSRHLPDVWPTYFKRAKGCKIQDLDGNNLIDFSLMGVGTNVLGYSHSSVDNAVKKIIDKGNMSSLNCPEEVALAEKLIEIHPWFDKVKFARTGGEANSIAIRIARAASNRDNVAICGYHGWHDWYLSANLNSKSGKNLDDHLLKGLNISGVPKKLRKTTFPFEYGDLNSLKNIIKNNKIGTIKMEVCRNTEPDIGFLKKVRTLANQNNIVLIFDECTTGFRETYGGLHKTTGVIPDVAIFGKALGNGYAITAIVGKESVMDYAQQSFISSTFWTERVGPAAALKTIEIMKNEKTWIKIKKIGKKIQKNWQTLSNQMNLGIKIKGIPSLTSFSFPGKQNLHYKTLITQEMLRNNFLASNTVYCSISHTDNIIKSYINKLENVFKIIKDCQNGHDINKFLKSKISRKDFKRLN